MRRHPNDEELLAFCEIDRAREPGSTVETPEWRDVRSHLAAVCERCSARVREFEAVLDRLSEPSLAEAPAAWIENAIAQIPPVERGIRMDAAIAIIRGVFEEVRLALALDTPIGAPVPGIRGASAARQFLFESQADPGGTRLYLQIEPSPMERFGIRGQLVTSRGSEPQGSAGESKAGAAAGAKTQRAAGRGSRRAARRAILVIDRPGPALGERSCHITGSGEFHFRAVPGGRVRIRIESGTRLFIADPVDLR